jgi:hypothetical protein
MSWEFWIAIEVLGAVVGGVLISGYIFNKYIKQVSKINRDSLEETFNTYSSETAKLYSRVKDIQERTIAEVQGITVELEKRIEVIENKMRGLNLKVKILMKGRKCGANPEDKVYRTWASGEMVDSFLCEKCAATVEEDYE